MRRFFPNLELDLDTEHDALHTTAHLPWMPTPPPRVSLLVARVDTIRPRNSSKGIVVHSVYGSVLYVLVELLWREVVLA